MLAGGFGLLRVVLHTAILYFFVVVLLSLLARRQVSEIGVMELVVVALLGSAVETSMVAGDTSLQAGLVAASTLLVCNWIMSHLQRRSLMFRRALRGRPVPLVYKGRFLEYGLREAGLSEDDVREGIRERGYERVEEVRLAMFEIDGSISVLPVQG